MISICIYIRVYISILYGTAAVQRLCLASVYCIETDLMPLRCDYIVNTVLYMHMYLYMCISILYGTAAVQRLCRASVYCIETDLMPLRCDHIVNTVLYIHMCI